MNLAAVQTADINQAHFSVQLPTDGESHLSVRASAKQFQSDRNHFLPICIQRAKLVGSLPDLSNACCLLQFCKSWGNLLSHWMTLFGYKDVPTGNICYRYFKWSTWEHGACKCWPEPFPQSLGAFIPSAGPETQQLHRGQSSKQQQKTEYPWTLHNHYTLCISASAHCTFVTKPMKHNATWQCISLKRTQNSFIQLLWKINENKNAQG